MSKTGILMKVPWYTKTIRTCSGILSYGFLPERSEQSCHAAGIIQLSRGASVVYNTVPRAPSNRGSDRTKNNDANTIDRNGGGSGRGLGGSNKGSHDLWNSRFTNGDSHNTNSDNPHKDKGIFICERMPYFKSRDKPDGAPHPPKVTVDGTEMIICMKGSSRGRVCANDR